MKAGSITIDLAAPAGGNIETTLPDERVVTENGVICMGPTNIVSNMAQSASTLLGNNMTNYIKLLHNNDLEEHPVLRSTCVMKNGVILPKYEEPVRSVKNVETEKEDVKVVETDPKVLAQKNALFATQKTGGALAVCSMFPHIPQGFCPFHLARSQYGKKC